RIYNPLPDRVAVALSVDGLNSIDARHTTARAASKWVIEPYSTITIGGWQMSSTRARRFYFTTERDSYAAKLGRAEDTGLISAVFFRERRPIVYVPPPRPYPRPSVSASCRVRILRPMLCNDANARAASATGSSAQSHSET